MAREVARVTKNVLFLGPGHLHGEINNTEAIVRNWRPFVADEVAKAAMGEKFKLVGKPLVRTNQYLTQVLFSAYQACRPHLRPKLLELAARSRVDAAALLYTLEVELTMAAVTYNVLVLNNFGDETLKASHYLAGVYANRNKKNYQLAEPWFLQQMEHLKKPRPYIYEQVRAHPLLRNEAAMEGGVIGRIARCMIKSDKDKIAVRKAKYEAFLNADRAYNAMRDALRDSDGGRQRKVTVDTMDDAVTRTSEVLLQFLSRLATSHIPDFTNVKFNKLKKGEEGRKVQSVTVAMAAFSPDPLQPLFFSLDKVGAPHYTLAMRHEETFWMCPLHPSSTAHRAANGCQGHCDPAKGGVKCNADASVPVVALDCGGIFCASMPRPDKWCCWICERLFLFDIMPKYAGRAHHLRTMTPKLTAGLRYARGGAARVDDDSSSDSDDQHDDEGEVERENNSILNEIFRKMDVMDMG
jgi:hypothetical protein